MWKRIGNTDPPPPLWLLNQRQLADEANCISKQTSFDGKHTTMFKKQTHLYFRFVQRKINYFLTSTSLKVWKGGAIAISVYLDYLKFHKTIEMDANVSHSKRICFLCFWDFDINLTLFSKFSDKRWELRLANAANERSTMAKNIQSVPAKTRENVTEVAFKCDGSDVCVLNRVYNREINHFAPQKRRNELFSTTASRMAPSTSWRPLTKQISSPNAEFFWWLISYPGP